MQLKNPIFPSILCFILLTSCGSSKIFEEPQVILQAGHVDSLVQGKYIYVKIDSAHSLKLKFDTGSTLTVLNDIASVGGEVVLNEKNHKKKQEVETATSFVSTIMYQSRSLNSDVSHAFNQTIAILKTNKAYFSCLSGMFSYDGVYGMDAFAEAGNPKPILLDYEHNLIKILLGSEKIPAGYRKVDATFDGNILYLHGTIYGEKIDFLFDTGYNGFILLSENIFKKDDSINPAKIGKSSLWGGSGSFIPEKGLTFQDTEVSIDGLSVNENVVNVIKKVKSEKAYVGLNFIKNYNWILDFKNEVLYAKKISEFDSDMYFETLKNFLYFALAVGEQLMIVYSNSNKYQVGDIILSVNGKKVNDSNLCTLQNLLIENRENLQEIEVVIK